MPRDFDRHVRARHPVHVIHQLEGRYRDNHEDQNRHHGPEHLDDGVVRGPRRHRIPFVAKTNNDVEQETQDEQSDQTDYDQEFVVKCRQPVFDRRRRRLHSDFPGPRPLRPSERSERSTADRHQRQHKPWAGYDLLCVQSRHLTLSLQPHTRGGVSERALEQERTVLTRSTTTASPDLFESRCQREAIP